MLASVLLVRLCWRDTYVYSKCIPGYPDVLANIDITVAMWAHSGWLCAILVFVAKTTRSLPCQNLGQLL